MIRLAPQSSVLIHMTFLCAVALGLSFFGSDAFARSDDGLFQIDTTHWTSYDHYKDPAKAPAVSEKTPEPHDAATAAAPSATATAPAIPAVAPPSRPLNLPSMPGMDKGYQVKITTTEDEKPTPPPASAAPPSQNTVLREQGDKEPDITPPPLARGQTDSTTDESEAPPLNVRMSFLPKSKVVPTPSPDHVSAQSQARLAMARAATTKKPEKTPAEVAACAAIDSYKKQQLDAIQTDRQTLKALQDAVTTLGLQKQMEFMTGTGGSLGGKDVLPQTNIDVPASTPVR